MTGGDAGVGGALTLVAQQVCDRWRCSGCCGLSADAVGQPVSDGRRSVAVGIADAVGAACTSRCSGCGQSADAVDAVRK